MAESAPLPKHLFLGGLLGGLVGIVAFIVLPNLVGEATDSANLKRFTEEDVIVASATQAPPRTPTVWEGRLAEPDWESAWEVRITFGFDVAATNASGDGRIQVKVLLKVQDQEAVEWVEEIRTQDGGGTYRVEGDAIRVDTQKPLTASAALQAQRFPNGGQDWSITLTPTTFRQVTTALDTDHDGVPQPMQPLEGMPSYFLTAILALVGVNGAYVWARNRPRKKAP